MKQSKIPEVFEDRKKMYTKNLVKGKTVYDEKLVVDKDVEYLNKFIKFLSHPIFQITFFLIQLLNYPFLINYKNDLDSFILCFSGDLK